MSVRAYRINKIEKESGETFNLWHDRVVVDYLVDSGITSSLNDDLMGIIEIEVKQLREISRLPGLDEDTRSSILKDIKFAVKNKIDYVHYKCF